MESVRGVDPQSMRVPNVHRETRARPSPDMTGLLLHLQRTAGNQAVDQFLRRQGPRHAAPRPARAAPGLNAAPEGSAEQGERQPILSRQMLHGVPRPPASAAPRPGAGQAILVQRKPGKDGKGGTGGKSSTGGITGAIKNAVVGTVGTDEQIANMVRTRGPDLTDVPLEELFKPVTEADLTPEQKAVRTNKAAFLQEDVERAAQEQRKIKHVHEGIRERKAKLGNELRKTKKGSSERAALKARLTVLEDADLAKLTPSAQEDKLKKAALKGEKKYWKERSTKGTVLGMDVPWMEHLEPHEQKRAQVEESLIQDELDEIARPAKELKRHKKELKGQLEKLEKKSKKGTVLGKRVPLMEQLTPQQEEAARVGKLLIKSRLAEVKKEQKSLKPAKQSDEWKKKINDKWGDQASDVLSGGSETAKLGSAAALGSREIAHLVGNTGVAGSSTTAGGHQVITQVGTATQGAAVESEVAGLLALGSDLAQFASISKAIQEGDEAQQLQAKLDAIDLGYSLGSRLLALGRGATAMAGDFGGSALATTMVADVMPGIDIASAGLQLIMHGQQLYDAADRLKSQGKHIEQAETAGHTHLVKVIGQFKEENSALTVSAGVDIVADVLKITGAAISLSGIGIIVGHPIKYVGVAVTVLNKGAMSTRAAVRTGKAQQARAANMLGQQGSEGKLLQHDPKHAIQTLINEARYGKGLAQELALKELRSLRIDEKTLAGSSDEHLRKLALSQMGVKENAKTIGQSLKEGAQGVKEWYHEDTGKQVETLRQVKNKLNYGGEGERGRYWTAKMRLLGGYDTESIASIHKILLSMSKEERDRLGITDEEVAATATQFERDLKKKEKSATPMTISGPMGILPFQPPHQPFQPPQPMQIPVTPQGIAGQGGSNVADPNQAVDPLQARLNALKQFTDPGQAMDPLQARLNALKQSTDPSQAMDPLQARLNALKQQTDPSQVAEDPLQARLNALKQQTDPSQVAEDPLQARLNALKQHTDPSQVAEDPLQARLNALKQHTDPSQAVDPLQARLNALKQHTDPGRVADAQLRARLDALTPNNQDRVVVDPQDPAFDRSARARLNALNQQAAPNRAEDQAWERSMRARLNALGPVADPDQAVDPLQARLNALKQHTGPGRVADAQLRARLDALTPNNQDRVVVDPQDPAFDRSARARLNALNQQAAPNRAEDQAWERSMRARLNALGPVADPDQEEDQEWERRMQAGMQPGRIRVEDAL